MSLKVAPFDGSYTTSYYSTILTIAPSSTIFGLFDADEYRDLEIQVRGQAPCEFIRNLYIAEICRLRTTFLLLIAWVFSLLHSQLQKSYIA